MHSCRCCLQRASVKDLTTSYTHLGTTEIYSDMLRDCFNLHLAVGGDGECGICEVCVSRLRDANDFKLQVQRNQVALLARLEAELLTKEESTMDQDMEEGVETCDELSSSNEESIKSELDIGETSVATSPDTKVKLEPSVFSRARACCVRLERLLSDEACLAISQHELRPASDVEDMSEYTTVARTEEPALTSGIFIKQFSDEFTNMNHLKEHTIEKKFRVKNTFESSKESPCKAPKHLQTKIGNITLSCDMCNKKFKAKSILIKHIKAHITQKQIKASNKIFLTRSVLKRHKNKPPTEETSNNSFTLEAVLKNRKTVDTSKNLFRDGECHNDFKTKSNLNTPISRKRYECEKCDQRFSSKCNLNRHLKLHINKPYYCGQCNKFFADEQSLFQHKKHHTREKHYRCGKCDFSCRDKNYIKKHTKNHLNKPYSCGQCRRYFSDEQSLLEHEKNHDGQYNCGKCNKIFSQKNHLVIHKRIHTGEKPFGCQECNLQFAQKEHLNRHKHIHSRVKPSSYTCPECNEKFLHKYSLTMHIIRTHTGPFECKVCNKRFNDKESLTKHKVTHTNEKRFSCEICNKKIKGKKYLKTHILNHARSFKCDICGSFQPGMRSLNKHIATHVVKKL